MCSLAIAQPPVDFDREVRPILQEHCWECHGPKHQQSGLRLDRRDSMLRGGDFGEPAIEPGNAASSPLIRYVSVEDDANAMPPPKSGRRRLNPEEVSVLARWIDAGAEWGTVSNADETASKHWSFQPIPEKFSYADLDAWVDARLEENGLQQAPEAPASMLIRRLSYDLIGLPPAWTRVQQFVQEHGRDPDLAVASLVEELLASPRYGERWARHWLDVVRFAESDGFEMNHPRPNAWHYRDYCIEAFNRDLPYDQFVRQQIAGDAFGDDRAMGFLVGGPWDRVKSPDPVLTANQRADELHDMVSVTGSAFLGLTVGCARCHSHKFDPITQSDYYRIKACLSGVQHGERPIASAVPADREARIAALQLALQELDGKLRKLEPLASLVPYGAAGVTAEGEATRSFYARSPVTHGENVERFAPVDARYVRLDIAATTGAEPCLDEVEIFDANGHNAARSARVVSSGDYANNPFHRLEHVQDGAYGNEKSWISNTAGSGRLTFDLGDVRRIDSIVWSRDRTAVPRYTDRVMTQYDWSISADGENWTVVANHVDRLSVGTPPPALPTPRAGVGTSQEGGEVTLEAERARRQLREQRQSLQKELAALTEAPKAYIGVLGTPETVHRLQRGDPMQPREAMEPGGIESLSGFRMTPDATEQERRVALADWMVSPDNPLTSRVIANRIWHYHFGVGIVDTPSDFGAGGGVPSHPELLDFLARELMRSGWSLKHLHRVICTSKAYRQSSQCASSEDWNRGIQRDASNRWLWRFPVKRLEAEPLRDAILSMAGTLDQRMGGPGFDLFVANENYVRVYESKSEFLPEDYRRMIYQRKPRAELDLLFGAFDCPDAGQIQPRRNVSTTPLQALNLLNSPFVLQQSMQFSKRLKEAYGEDPVRWVESAFREALSRDPSDEEREVSLALIDAHGLAAFCRGLLNSHAFITID